MTSRKDVKTLHFYFSPCYRNTNVMTKILGDTEQLLSIVLKIKVS